MEMSYFLSDSASSSHSADSAANRAARSPRAIPRCNYEGSPYQQSFWTAERAYEDAAERVALRHLLPAGGQRMMEIGAGAGRLGDLYSNFEQVVLMDYAYSQVGQARQRWLASPHYSFAQGDIYTLPFPDNHFDLVVTVRVLHHVKDISLALREVARVLKPGGIYITEFANKRNLKAVLRYGLGRGKKGENPFSLEPWEWLPLNIDYHPRFMLEALAQAGFETEEERAASFFRVGMLKRLLPTPLLVRADATLQEAAAPLRLTPSIFLKNRLVGQ